MSTGHHKIVGVNPCSLQEAWTRNLPDVDWILQQMRFSLPETHFYWQKLIRPSAWPWRWRTNKAKIEFLSCAKLEVVSFHGCIFPDPVSNLYHQRTFHLFAPFVQAHFFSPRPLQPTALQCAYRNDCHNPFCFLFVGLSDFINYV